MTTQVKTEPALEVAEEKHALAKERLEKARTRLEATETEAKKLEARLEDLDKRRADLLERDEPVEEVRAEWTEVGRRIAELRPEQDSLKSLVSSRQSSERKALVDLEHVRREGYRQDATGLGLRIRKSLGTASELLADLDKLEERDRLSRNIVRSLPDDRPKDVSPACTAFSGTRGISEARDAIRRLLGP